MKIIAIDDDQVALSVLTWILEQDGHRVTIHTDPAAALSDVQPDVDLVISDVNMPGLDGFAIAQRVAASPGDGPPRTLLISGDDHHERVDRTPPAEIIGLVDKPISLGHMHRIIRLIGLTRRTCPGSLTTSSCPVRDEAGKQGDLAAQPWSHFCLSGSYGRCPHYNEHAGRALRASVKNPFYASVPA